MLGFRETENAENSEAQGIGFVTLSFLLSLSLFLIHFIGMNHTYILTHTYYSDVQNRSIQTFTDLSLHAFFTNSIFCDTVREVKNVDKKRRKPARSRHQQLG